MKKIPVILDTDIGGDIDDTWALGMLLKSPELDLKLVTTCTADTFYRAKICAKMLERAGRSDIPVAAGIRQKSDGPRERQLEWVRDYELSSYSGVFREDGVTALIETIEKSPEPVTLIAIGPVTNIAEALRRSPGIAAKVNFAGMLGSISKQHHGKPGAIAEFNVVQDIPACQAVFRAPWRSAVITPLDTCGLVKLGGSLFQSLAASKDRIVMDILENYRVWLKASGDNAVPSQSSILFDTVAVHLAYSTEFLKMEKMRLAVNDKGFTVIDPAPPIEMNVAIDWLGLDAYHKFLTARLLS